MFPYALHSPVLVTFSATRFSLLPRFNSGFPLLDFPSSLLHKFASGSSTSSLHAFHFSSSLLLAPPSSLLTPPPVRFHASSSRSLFALAFRKLRMWRLRIPQSWRREAREKRSSGGARKEVVEDPREANLGRSEKQTGEANWWRSVRSKLVEERREEIKSSEKREA